jgi:(p)ppGpp synthase/HD superfamily hydrolase
MPWSQEQAVTALEFAAMAHGNLAIQCAFFHDVLEDTDATESAVEVAFGPLVLRGIRALTKNKALPPAERSAGYRDEAQLIHDSLKHCHEWLTTRLLQKIEEYRKHL